MCTMLLSSNTALGKRSLALIAIPFPCERGGELRQADPGGAVAVPDEISYMEGND